MVKQVSYKKGLFELVVYFFGNGFRMVEWPIWHHLAKLQDRKLGSTAGDGAMQKCDGLVI